MLQMLLNYPNKRTVEAIFDSIVDIVDILNTIDCEKNTQTHTKPMLSSQGLLNNNFLIQSDNLIALKYLIKNCNLAGKVDLIYIAHLLQAITYSLSLMEGLILSAIVPAVI